MRKLIHIGHPKNFSTSIQRGFFGAHKDLYHLGIGSDKKIGYKDELCSALFEVYLKSAKWLKFEEEFKRLKTHIGNHIENAKKTRKKCLTVSSEHISFGFIHESIDFKTKIDRIINLFGKKNLHFVMIIRDQGELIRSLYRESVRVGFSGTFREYIYNMYKFQDRNCVYDFRYDLLYEYMLKVLPEANIHVLFFEEFRNSSGELIKNNGKIKLLENLSNIAKVEYYEVSFNHHNRSLTEEEINLKSVLNKYNRHDLGRDLLNTAEIHRQENYFKTELGIKEKESEVYKDVILKRKIISKVQKQCLGNNTTINYSCDPDIKDWFDQFYSLGNDKLKSLLKKNIPDNYFHINL